MILLNLELAWSNITKLVMKAIIKLNCFIVIIKMKVYCNIVLFIQRLDNPLKNTVTCFKLLIWFTNRTLKRFSAYLSLSYSLGSKCEINCVTLWTSVCNEHCHDQVVCWLFLCSLLTCLQLIYLKFVINTEDFRVFLQIINYSGALGLWK